MDILKWINALKIWKEPEETKEVPHDESSYLIPKNPIAPYIKSTYTGKSHDLKKEGVFIDLKKNMRYEVRDFFMKTGKDLGEELKVSVKGIKARELPDLIDRINSMFEEKAYNEFSRENLEVHTKKSLRELRYKKNFLNPTKDHLIIDVDGRHNILRRDYRYGIIFTYIQNIDGTPQYAVGAYIMPEANTIVHGALGERSIVDSRTTSRSAIIPPRMNFFGENSKISIERKKSIFTKKFLEKYNEAMKIFSEFEKRYKGFTENKQYSIGYSLMKMIGGWEAHSTLTDLNQPSWERLHGVMVMRSALWEGGLVTIARGSGGEAYYLRSEEDLKTPSIVQPDLENPSGYFPIVFITNRNDFRNELFKNILETYNHKK